MIMSVSKMTQEIHYPKIATISLVAVSLLFSVPIAHAGFLEMPDTEEVPEYEAETLLLDLDIPSVRERDPDPEAGPRLNVREFRIQGIVEYPERGISREELIERVEAIRFELMDEGELLDSGYTLDELGELSDLIANIEEETKDQHVGPVEVQRLVFLIREQRRKRGVTLGMIESVADTITRYYRERGFILAKAYIPEQQVRDGVVTLTLLLGELGEVEVQNNKRYSSWLIGRTFNSAMGEPVTTSDIEERLYLANDLPGLSVQGYFQPGSQVGDTKLNINVLNERWYDSNVRIDNHGSASSGEYRLYADVFVHNPLRIGDQLQLGVLGTFEPDNTTYGSLRYQTNIVNPRVRIFVGASTNDFVVGDDEKNAVQTGLKISGKSFVVDGGLSYAIRRSRVKNSSVELIASEIETTTEFRTAEDDILAFSLEDTVRTYRLTYHFDRINEKKRVLHQGNVALTSSNLVDGAEEGQKEEAGIFSYNYSMLTFFKLPFFKSESRIVAKSSGQYAGTGLSSVSQFSLTGPTRARGFEVNKFFADDAIYLAADWIFNGPGFGKVKVFDSTLADIVQPFLFVDASYGIKHPIAVGGADEVTGEFANIGLGLKFTFKQSMRGNLVFAEPLHNNISSLSDQEDPGLNMYFDLQYSF